MNNAISSLKKPRDYEPLQKFVIGIVLFVLFAPLFLLALIVVYNLLFEVVQFEVWESILKFFELEVNTVEPSFGFAALLAAILSAPFVIWRTWVAHQDYKVKEQGHITDRINKAVENLGAHKTNKDSETIPNLEVRIGGIFALERIAQDSLRDHIQIMEILCAYLQKNAPLSQASSSDELKNNKQVSPRTDIQIALSVIGRRSKKQILVERRKQYRLDLSNMNLQRLIFTKCDLNNAIIRNSSLIEASFNQTNLEEALLDNCDLLGAFMINVNFKGAIIRNLVLKNCSFNICDFLNAKLSDLAIQNTFFSLINLKSEQLKYTFGDASVFLGDVKKPSHWSKEYLNENFDARFQEWKDKQIPF